MLEQEAASTNTAVFHPNTHIGFLELTVADLERSLTFYQDVIGFQILARKDKRAVLGVEQRPLLVLFENKEAQPKPYNAVGLYHFAILVPDRVALAHTLVKLATTKYPLGGASDHAVSEALYLSDPDGNGIEIYRDRPRSEWSYRGKEIAMVTERLDIDGVLGEARHIPEDWQGLVPGTTIGHMHLQVADLTEAEAFYCKLLGFEIAARMPGALFVSAGGYHHHLGLNTWDSRGGKRAPAGSAGLRSFSITLPDTTELENIEKRLQLAGQTYAREKNSININDPWQNQVILTAGTFSTEDIAAR
ncbi:catechol-2,3-dioxygenase [Ktedonobacteria bacterium brp13]|nr:catechol-2,3-dioxygenase [Ktedonobacteria bacterium brp13]